MKSNVKRIAALALVVPAMAACATKGFVKKAIADEHTATGASIAQVDSSVARERADRIAGDSSLKADVASLHKDLDSLRSEFGAKITAMQDGMKFAFPVNFAFDDATIRDQDRAALDRFAKVVNKYYGGSTITVEGFADPAGSKSYNVALSKKRADAVKDYLASQNVTGEIKTVGYGKTRLVVPKAQKDDPGAEQNRRVVFVIESKGGNGVAMAGSGK